MKWRGSLRGDGALVGAVGERPVSYRIDLYAQGDHRSSNGDVQGDLAIFLEAPPAGLRLKLDDGREVEVSLVDAEPDAARIELHGAAGL